MRFVNDHDPLPLLGQIQQRYGNQVGINYVARDPGNIVIDFTIQLGAPGCGGRARRGWSGGGGLRRRWRPRLLLLSLSVLAEDRAGVACARSSVQIDGSSSCPLKKSSAWAAITSLMAAFSLWS